MVIGDNLGFPALSSQKAWVAKETLWGWVIFYSFASLFPIAHAFVRTPCTVACWLVGWAEMRVIFGNGRAGSVAVAVIYLREGSLRSTVVVDVLVEEQCWCCTWNLEQCWCCCSVVGGNGGDFPTLPPATPTSRARACTSIHNMRHTLHTGVFCLHTTTPCTILPLFLLCTFRNFTVTLA